MPQSLRALTTFLKAHGIKGLANKRDWPKYVQQEPEAYEDVELAKFFAVCDEEERVFFEFYLMTGFRKKEVTYCYWKDVNLKSGIVRVTAKGTIEEVVLGTVMAHVVVRVGDNLIESAITRRSADELHLKKGDTVIAIIKSTEVMIQKD